MTRFIIVRHGYSENNKEKKFTGHIDVNLDKIGYSQAEAKKAVSKVDPTLGVEEIVRKALAHLM